MNPGRELSRWAKESPKKIALIFKEEKISFGDLNQRANTLASALRRMGVEKGERVLFMLPNGTHFAITYFAITKLGAIAVPLDIRLRWEEILPTLYHCEPKVLITFRSLYYLFENLFDTKAILIGGQGKKGDFLAWEDIPLSTKEIETETKDPEDALYLYTSGTTGRQKAVVLTFGNLDESPRVMGEVVHTGKDDIAGIILPMSHISGPILLNGLAAQGSTLVIFESLRPEGILETIERHQVNWFHGVPLIFQLLLESKKEYRLQSLKWIAMMGTQVPLNLVQEFAKKYPHVKVIQGYGLTETSPFISLTPLEKAEEKPSSIGRPVPRAEVRVVDEKGRPLPKGQVGEIIVRGPMVMKGYYKDPQATSERIKDGWLYTGDLGKFDEDGYLYFMGRRDELIITGGLNVYPQEIEGVLLAHPKIAEVAVAGVPDEKRQRVIKAIIVSKEEVSKKEILDFLKGRLASYKLPSIIEFRKDLPKTSTGKVIKGELVTSGSVRGIK